MDFLSQTNSTNIIIEIIRAFFIIIYTYLITFKLMNYKIDEKITFIKILLNVVLITVIYIILKVKINFFNSTILLGLMISISMYTFMKYGLGYLTIACIFSLGINYVIFFIAIMISFIPNAMLNIENRFIGLFSLIFIYSILIFFFTRLKRIKSRYSIFIY